MIAALLLVSFLSGSPTNAATPGATDAAQFLRERNADFVALYEELHAAPELSLFEERTAARMASELAALGFQVTGKVGGHGVVGVLENGAGRTLLVRCDMDALPLEEKTGLAYASRVQATLDGKQVPVMHACGHDLHMTVWLATAAALARTRDAWKGKLVFIAQPAEEKGRGARAMLDDRLFERFGKPDGCLALHMSPFFAAGTVALCPGYALANAESCDILVKGRGGHGSMPHLAIDPVVIAARIVLGLQTVISREKDPRQPGVITVGAIHGGNKHNIIPDDVALQLTIRSYDDQVHERLKSGIQRVCKAEAESAGAPAPDVNFSESVKSTYNDPVWCARLKEVLGKELGSANVHDSLPVMGAEDFGLFGRAGVPAVMLWLGAWERGRFEAAQRSGETLPGLHSSAFAPDPAPAIEAGARALHRAVVDALQNGVPAEVR